MDKDLSDSDCQANQESDNEQSLVNKFKKNVTEIISNTPLSKWFRKQTDTPTSTIRRRQDDSDDEGDFHEFQPPTKRTKLPPTKETLSLNVSEALSPIASLNNVKKPMFKNFPEPIPGPSGYQTRKMLNSTSFTTETNFKSTKTVRETRETSESMFKNPRILTSTVSEGNNVQKEGHSDSEESTSGYSSGRIGSKEVVSQESSKQTSPLENSPRKARSLFQSSSSGLTLLSDRSLSPNRNSSLSSRMPSFNPSTFGSSNYIDRTLSTKRILNSPFYNGNTVYGGASAYGRGSKRVPQDMRKVLRQSISIKPVNKGNEKGDLQLGKTARRILDTLEQYSSPISDAKKIPVSSKRFKSEGALTQYIGANPYSVRASRNASNKELQVPSVTDLLKMKIEQQKTRLQDSTEAVRQIANKSKSVLNEESYQIPVQREKDRHTGKIKTKITSLRHKTVIDEPAPELRLNPVSLPIKELPKFDIVVPPPSVALKPSNIGNIQAKSACKPVEQSSTSNKPVEVTFNVDKPKENFKASDKDMDFQFSDPMVLAEYLKPLKALNNFKFSEPLVKKRRSIHPELDDQENKAVEGKKSKKNNGENFCNVSGGLESKKEGNGLSLMDKFKPKEGTWECSACMIRNQADKTKCAACETSRSSGQSSGNKASISETSHSLTKSISTPSSFGDKFKAPSNTWECSTCMIRNKEDVQKCVACETKKPVTASSKSKDSTTNKFPSNTVPPTFAFGDKFKATSDSWECPTCMIRNKNDITKCVACETQKPGGAVSNSSASKTGDFGTLFAPPPSTWECSVCMIRNKDELLKCIACENPKPGAKNQASGTSFGSDFQKKEDEWECGMCMVRNKSTTAKCQCCEASKPGSSTSSSAIFKEKPKKVTSFSFGIDKNTATGFTFGIPATAQTNENTPKTNASQIFGENKKEEEKKEAPPTFSFGVPSTTDDAKKAETKKDTPSVEKPKSSEQEPTKAIPTFSFGTPKTSEKEPSKNTPTTTFSFGTPKTSDKDASKPTTTPTFSFGTPKTTDKDSSKAIPTFSFGPPKSAEKDSSKTAPTFSFGTPKTTDKDSSKTMPTFSFGTPNKTEGAGIVMGTPTFTLGVAKTGVAEHTAKEVNKVNPLLKASEKLPEKVAVAPSGFSFGLSKVSSFPSVSSTTSTKPAEGFSTDESPSKRSKPVGESSDFSKIPMFTFKAPTTNGDLNKISPFTKSVEGSKPAVSTLPGGFSFKPNVTKPAAPTSAIVTPTFGSTVSKADSSNPAAAFKFGAPSSTAQTNGFSFGASAPTFGAKPANSSEIKPFSFTSPAPTTQTALSPFHSNPTPTNQTTSSPFASNPTLTNQTASSPFHSNPTHQTALSPFQSNTNQTAPSLFQSNTNQTASSPFQSNPTPTSQTASSLFQSNPTPFQSNPPPAFGATPAKAPMFQFGSSASESKPQTSAPTFSFNAPAAETKPAPQFSFGATTTQAPSFGFGQAAPAPSFNFAPTPHKPVPVFGAAPTTNPFAPANNKPTSVFGAAPTQQSSAPNGMFNFGSPTATNQKAGFSFGATSGSGEAPGASGGFGFGSSAAAAPTASGGFNFSSAPPSFDANAKPSFNFTGGAGIAAFAAPPTQDMPQRKIKKAIRRTVR